MRFFSRKPRTMGWCSNAALAVALATGTLVAFTGFSDVAHAKEKKKKKQKAQYSKEFIAAYTPIDAAIKGGSDPASVVPMLDNLVALAVSPDEKMVAGNVLYMTGGKVKDMALQLRGMSLMLESGKVEAENLGKYNFVGYQLANALGQHAKAREFLQQAIAQNYTTAQITPATLRVAMAESFFAENRFAEGLDYLMTAIRERKAAGQTIEEQWYTRGLSVAYNNEVTPQVYDFATMWVKDYPSEKNWRDAINIARNLNDFTAGEMLDLLRLGFRLKVLENKNDYIDYVEAADARRLPQEVKTVIEEGYASGKVSRDDIYIADSLKTANGRIASDKRELPALERDAMAPGASARTVFAAGDAFLSYGDYAKAARFYERASSMSGIDKDAALLRWGIALGSLGDFDGATAALSQVSGKRIPIARLWQAYFELEASKAPAASATAVATIPAS